MTAYACRADPTARVSGVGSPISGLSLRIITVLLSIARIDISLDATPHDTYWTHQRRSMQVSDVSHSGQTVAVIYDEKCQSDEKPLAIVNW